MATFLFSNSKSYAILQFIGYIIYHFITSISIGLTISKNVTKVFERIVLNDMYEYLTTNKLLSDRNSGFRKNDSAINRLLALLDGIYKGLDDRKDIFLILSDISKAFEKVWHPGLI